MSPLLRLIVSSILVTSAVVCAELVDQKDRKFSKTDVSLKPGDNITFTNSDDVAHNVFSVTPGLEFEIRRQAPNEKTTISFAKEGVVEVRCSIHPRMKMLVTVKK